jgi:hypothetical protein
MRHRFVGFQAARARWVAGSSTAQKSVRMLHAKLSVRARIFTINGLSAHADRDALLGWISQFQRAPRQTYVVHGESLAADSLRNAIAGMGWRAAGRVRGARVSNCEPGAAGLSGAEAARRLAAEGRNALPAADRRSGAAIVLGVLREPMFSLLAARPSSTSCSATCANRWCSPSRSAS